MSGFIKGMVIGLAVGGAATIAMLPKSSKTHRTLKRSANRAIRGVAGMVDSVSDMF